MITLSFKLSDNKVRIIILSVAVFILGVWVFLTGMKIDSKEKINISDNGSIVEYIESFGWCVEKEPIEKELVFIPSQFNDVYLGYNKIQKEQGFNLEKYKGEEVYRYTYKVTNYSDKDNVRLNLLIEKNGRIIGGDICSTELNGFMEAFK